jgi:hypothetical protein
MTEKDHLCLKKVYPVRRAECIPMRKQRFPRLPTAFTAKRDVRRAKNMSTGLARSEKCVEGLPCAPKVRELKLRPRVLGPKILRSKSKSPESCWENGRRAASDSARKGSRARSRPKERLLASPISWRAGRERTLSFQSSATAPLLVPEFLEADEPKAQCRGGVG